MATFYTDTDVLEMARDRMGNILSKMEESYGTTRQMFNQMVTEVGFDGYPQWNEAVDTTERVMQEIERLCQRMEVFKAILDRAPGEYLDLEKEHIKLIEQMNTRMGVIQAGFTAVLSNDFPLGIEESMESSKAGQLEKQTENAVIGLEMANLMAISKVLEEEYQFEKVEPVDVMTYIDSSKDSGKGDE